MQPLRKDTLFFLDGVELRVVRQLDDFHVQLENVMTGELEKRSSYSLQEAYMQRRLKTTSEMLRDGGRGASKRQPDRMDGMSPAARKETHRRIDYLVRLEKMDVFGKPRKKLRRCIAEIAEQRGEAYPPHETTVYRWRRLYLKARGDVRALFSAADQRGGRGQSRLDPIVALRRE